MKKAMALTVAFIASSAIPAMAASQPLPVPKDAKLVGTATLAEIREFPEETQTKAGPRGLEEAQGVHGTDRLYETDSAYADAVSFLDQVLKDEHFVVHRRTTTRTSTLWTLSRPDGTAARLAVRNTKPTTVEWVTALEATETGSESQPRHPRSPVATGAARALSPRARLAL